jgi:hypothetical protein
MSTVLTSRTPVYGMLKSVEGNFTYPDVSKKHRTFALKVWQVSVQIKLKVQLFLITP